MDGLLGAHADGADREGFLGGHLGLATVALCLVGDDQVHVALEGQGACVDGWDVQPHADSVHVVAGLGPRYRV